MTTHDSAASTTMPIPKPGFGASCVCGAPLSTRDTDRLRAVSQIMANVSDGIKDTSQLHSVATVIAESLNADNVTVFEADDQGQLNAIFTNAEVSADECLSASIAVEHPIVVAALATNAPMLVGENGAEPNCLKFCDDVANTSQQYIVPVTRSGDLIGLMLASSNSADRLRSSDVELVSLFGGQLGCCLRQIGLNRVLADTQSNLREQFMRAEKMRTMGEMASGVFHDFNNILGAVVGRVQLIHYKTDDEDVKRSLAQIERIALQGAETVKRLQEFSRLHEQHEVGSTDLNRVIEDALEVTRHRWESQAQSRGISYQIDRRLGNDVDVAGVHAQLVDAVANLIRNALDAMDQGGRLYFETNRSGGVCRLSVRDEGHGMTPEDAEKVFAPFFTTKGNDGTGLGMTIVQDIIRSHQGTISIESTPNVGTTFRIDIPVYKEASKPPRENPVDDSPDQLKLLVVDDDHIILDVVTEVLADAGHAVDSFSHGADAISALETSDYDVVVTDLGMPDVTGWEVARAAKMHTPPIPVVVISGWGAQFSEEQLGDSGVDAMLAKPFHLKILRETIERLAVGDTKDIPAVRT